MKLLRRAGVTSEVWPIFVQDNSKTTGEGLSTLSATNTSVLCYYKRNTGNAAVQVTLADMTLGAYTSGGLKAVANMPGMYDFCPPDAALATGASSVSFLLYPATTTVAMAPVPIEVQLTAADLDDATDLGLSTLDAAISTRLPTSSYVAPDNTGTAAIQAKTDQMTFTAGDIRATLAGESVDVGSYATTTVAPLQPTVPGRTLDVAATGEAGLDFSNILNAASTTAVDIIINTVNNVLAVDPAVADDILDPVFAYVQTLPDQTGAGGNELILKSGAKSWDDAYTGMVVLLRSSGGVWYESARITDYVGLTRTATVDKNWLSTPSENDQVKIVGLSYNEAAQDVNVVSLTDSALARIAASGVPMITQNLGRPVTWDTTSVTLPASIGSYADSIKGCTMVLLDVGDAVKAVRLVSAYDQATNKVTVSTAWSTGAEPGDDDKIRIYGPAAFSPAVSSLLETVEGTITVQKALRAMLAALTGKSSGHTSGASTPKYRDQADTKDRIDAVTDANGNRTSVTLDLD